MGSERHLTRRETGAPRAGSVFLGGGRLRARPLAHSRSHRRALAFSRWDATSQRVYEHKRNIFLMLQHTALTKHSLEFDHRFDFDNVKIVDKETNLNQRILLETIHTIKLPIVNLRYETRKIQEYYATLLKK